MSTRVKLFGGLGVLGTLLALGFAFVPGPLLAIGPLAMLADVVGERGATSVMLGASMITGLYGAFAARTGRGDSRSPERSRAAGRYDAVRENPPEAVTAGRRQLTAAAYDEHVSAALEGSAESLGRVRTLLGETAADVYADVHEVPREEAITALESGTWTSDPVAAAFLAGPDGPTPSTWERVRLWLVPGAERERRLERTLAAIDALFAEGQT